MNRWELEKQITLQALKNNAFKEKLRSHPKETLKELFKTKISQKFLGKLKINIHEEKKNEWTISIPYLNTKEKNFPMRN